MSGYRSGPEDHLRSPLAARIRALEQGHAALGRAAAGPLRFTRAEVVDAQGNPRQVIGAQPDGTYATRDIGGPIPPAPATPIVATVRGGFRVVTNGRTAEGGYWPADVERIDIYASQDLAFTTAQTTPSGSMGTLPAGYGVSALAGLWWVRLVALSRSGSPSPATPAVSVTVLSGEAVDELARQAAADAQAAADGAAAAALHAQQTADAVVANPDGTTTTYSPNPPTGSATPGSTWFRVGAGDRIVGQWGYTNGAWVAYRLDSAVIASIVAGQILTGSLSATTRITIGNPAGDHVLIDGAAGIFAMSATTVRASLPLTGSPYFSGDIFAATFTSLDYVESLSGMRLGADGRAEFQYVQVTQALAARTVEAQDFILAGRSVAAALAQRSSVLVAQGYRPDINLQGKVEECGIAEMRFAADPGRSYVITVNGGEVGSSASDTRLEFRWRYTLDGTVPTPQSPELRYIGTYPGGSDFGRMLSYSFPWYSEATTAGQQVKLFLTFRRCTGAGTVGFNTVLDGTRNRSLQCTVTDVGPSSIPNTMVANHYELAQPGGSAPPAVPPPSKRQYEWTFYATQTASYGGSGALRSRNGLLYQGYIGESGGAARGNQRSIVCFDLGDFRGRIPTGARIISATFAGTNLRTYAYGGGTVFIGSHGADYPPDTFPFGGLSKERRASLPVSSGGVFRQECTGIVEEIRDSAASGFLIGAAPDNSAQWYSYYVGAGNGRPEVYVKWEV